MQVNTNDVDSSTDVSIVSGKVHLRKVRARTIRTVRENPCTSVFPLPMRGSILMSTCPREAHTDGYRKSVDDAQYLFLDAWGMRLQSSANAYHAFKIDSEQWGVGDSILYTHKFDFWRCVLVVIPYTSGQAGCFGCKLCLGQEVLLTIRCSICIMWRCASNAESDLGHAHRISITLSLTCLRYTNWVNPLKVQVSPLKVSTTTDHQSAACSFQHVTDMYTLLNHVIDFREIDQSRFHMACN